MGIAQILDAPSIFKYAVGSTSLGRDWLPIANDGLLGAMFSELSSAMPQGTKPSCFIFVQGESDGETGQMANAYPALLHHLIERVREKFPAIPIVLSVDEFHPWLAERPGIAAAQKALANDKDTAFVSFSDLEKADQTHLTAESTIIQGRRLAESCRAMGVNRSATRSPAVRL